jgi:hypothetical protein
MPAQMRECEGEGMTERDTMEDCLHTPLTGPFGLAHCETILVMAIIITRFQSED